jgi:hypothetical protein
VHFAVIKVTNIGIYFKTCFQILQLQKEKYYQTQLIYQSSMTQILQFKLKAALQNYNIHSKGVIENYELRGWPVLCI